MEKRNHPRVCIRNLSVDASDGVGFFHGEVSDASRFGLCLTEVPRKLNEKAKKITVVISGLGENFKMTVTPRWYSTNGLIKSVGAEIQNPPWGWTEFIMNFEPKANDDIWGAAR